MDDMEWVNKTYSSIKFGPSTIDEGDRSLIAVLHTNPVGLGRLTPLKNPCGTGCGGDTEKIHWELGGIYVVPEARGKGTAREIVKRLIEEAQKIFSSDQKPMTLWCIPFVHLREFYESCGFINVENFSDRLGTLPQSIRCKLSGCATTFPDKPTILMKMELNI